MKAIFSFTDRPKTENVNFESLGLVPPVTGLVEKRGEIVPGMENVWYEYVPASVAGKKSVPLIVHLHGGGNDGLRWSEKTVWHKICDREGMILVYPNSPDYGSWACDARDVQYIADLIEHLCRVYPVDRSRIFVQGMSNGDMMTLAFTMAHPEIPAAAGYMTGPSAPEAIDGDRPAGPLPVIQMRGELDIYWRLTPETQDIYETRYSMNDLNRELWTGVNGIGNEPPLLEIRGRDNYLLFRGKNAPLINWEVQDMGHRDAASGAEVLWDRLYSGCRNENGTHIVSGPTDPIRGDENTVLIGLGSRLAYRAGKLIPFYPDDKGCARVFTPSGNGKPMFRVNEMNDTEVMMVPVEFLRDVYGASLSYDGAHENAYLTLADGRQVSFMNGAVLIQIDGRFTGISKPAINRCGVFYIPVGEVMQLLYNAHVSLADDMLAISDHYSLLGRYTARVVRRWIGGTPRPHTRPE